MTDYRDLFASALREAPPLSASGAQRREHMRDALQHAVVRRRQRRNATRWGSAALLVVALGAFGVRVLGRTGEQTPSSAGDRLIATAPVLQNAQFAVVHDAPDGITRWLAAPAASTTVELVDDQQMAHLLASIERPCGFIRTNGVLMLTAQVTDPMP